MADAVYDWCHSGFSGILLGGSVVNRYRDVKSDHPVVEICDEVPKIFMV